MPCETCSETFYSRFTAPFSVLRLLTPPTLSHQAAKTRAEHYSKIVEELPQMYRCRRIPWTTETHYYGGGSSGPAHSASGPSGTRCVSGCKCMSGDTPIDRNSLFHSMSSIICSRSRLDRYQYHPGTIGVSVSQFSMDQFPFGASP